MFVLQIIITWFLVSIIFSLTLAQFLTLTDTHNEEFVTSNQFENDETVPAETISA
mgnify:CR=1 FL=1